MHLNASNMHLSAVVWFRQSLMQTKNATTFCCQERQKCVHQSQPFGSHLRQGRKSRSKVEKKKVLKEAPRKGTGRSRIPACRHATQSYRSNDLGRRLGNCRNHGCASSVSWACRPEEEESRKGGGGRGNALTGVFVRGHNRTTACSISLACVRLCVYT